jgi:hypothetical protein
LLYIFLACTYFRGVWIRGSSSLWWHTCVRRYYLSQPLLIQLDNHPLGPNRFFLQSGNPSPFNLSIATNREDLSDGQCLYITCLSTLTNNVNSWSLVCITIVHSLAIWGNAVTVTLVREAVSQWKRISNLRCVRFRQIDIWVVSPRGTRLNSDRDVIRCRPREVKDQENGK